MDFEQAAAGILAREKERFRAEARAELAELERDPEHWIELRILRKMLWDQGARGRGLDAMLGDLGKNPSPLSAYLADRPAAPGFVLRYIEEVRQERDRLIAQARHG
jgi:hypothetical protein